MMAGTRATRLAFRYVAIAPLLRKASVRVATGDHSPARALWPAGSTTDGALNMIAAHSAEKAAIYAYYSAEKAVYKVIYSP
jgi:hypothetical protein